MVRTGINTGNVRVEVGPVLTTGAGAVAAAAAGTQGLLDGSMRAQHTRVPVEGGGQREVGQTHELGVALNDDGLGVPHGGSGSFS